MITFVTVNFNTTLLTTCLCCSLKKHHPDCKIVIFDNSTTEPLPDKIWQMFGVDYYDNTNGNLLNFEQAFNSMQLPRDEKCVSINSLGSAKHTMTIEYLLWKLPYHEIVLLDSDILLKCPIDFCNQKS